MKRTPVSGLPPPPPPPLAPASALSAVASHPAVTSRAPTATMAAPSLRFCLRLSNIRVPSGRSRTGDRHDRIDWRPRYGLTRTLAAAPARCLLSTIVDVVFLVVAVPMVVPVVGVTRIAPTSRSRLGVRVRRHLRLPLASQLVLVQLILIGAVLLAVSAVSVEITQLGFARDEGRRVLTLAESLAANPVVRTRNPASAGSVLPAVFTQMQTVTGIGLAMI